MLKQCIEGVGGRHPLSLKLRLIYVRASERDNSGDCRKD